MRVALGVINVGLKRDYGVEIKVRTALHTGDVVAGAGETLVTGDAVNVAARLEQNAKAGEILLGDQTARLLEEAALMEPVPELTLKGKAEPVSAWRLISVLPDMPAFTRPLKTAFVGRGGELASLEASFEHAVAASRCELVTVLGAPGIGKSRLLREAVSSLGSRARVLVGRCLPYGEGITYWPLVEIVKEIAGEEPHAVISELLSEDESGELVAELVAGAVGAWERPGSIDETHWAVRRLLEALADARPLVVVLEDLHWAESTFLDLLEYVAAFSANAPILLLASARPELLETRPSWAKVRPTSELLLLEPLAEPEVETLIDARLEAGVLSERLRARVLEVAEGNPLFVEQLLAMQAEGGDGDGELGVPPSLQALLAARIDRLETGERAVLERAAVEGRSFHRGAVAQLLAPLERASVGARLLALVHGELIHPDRSEFADEDGYRFAHVLIRDAAYESTAKGLRAELHEGYANWLEQKAGDRIREYEEILGYHLEHAWRYRGELVPVDEQTLALSRRAAMWLASAGRRARARRDWPAAAALLSRAVSLLPEGDADRLGLLPDLGESIGSRGDHRAAIAVLEEAIEQAEAAGDVRTRSYAVLFNVANRAHVEPGFTAEEWLSEAQEALRVFEELGDEGGQAFACGACAMSHAARGHYAEARTAIERALSHATAAGDERMQHEARAFVCYCLFCGAASLDELLSYAESLEPPAVEGRPVRFGIAFFRTLGQAYAMRGQFETARTLIAEEVAGHEELGKTLWATIAAAMGLGAIELLAGDPAAAERHLRRGYGVSEDAGDTGNLSYLAALLAEAVDAQGRHAEAEHYTRISEEAAAPDDYASQILWRSVRAKAIAREDTGGAEQLARAAVTLAADTDDIDQRGDSFMALAEVLLLAERPGEAVPVIEEALRLFELKGNVVSARKPRALLGDLQRRSEPP
jgi:hypothetical protein